MSECHCGSGRKFDQCCEPVIKEKSAATALVLMKSRYSAYVIGETKYLHETTHSKHRAEHKIDEIEKWAKQNKWSKLEIVSVEHGSVTDTNGIVEFKAYFTDQKGTNQIHHERSTFSKEDGKWYYVSGDLNPQAVDLMRKITRNDPCPCGSGKKFKKCCG